jgi:site-specific DNA-methyltransferase (adenine-specific)
MGHAPRRVRDAIRSALIEFPSDASLAEICESVDRRLGTTPESSIRSSLNLNVPEIFERVGRGRYKLSLIRDPVADVEGFDPTFETGNAKLYQANCFDWLAAREPESIEAVVTDPPYGLTEYTEKEQAKLREGKGGIWRIPPKFDGHQRSPLPRFTVMSDGDRDDLQLFFKRFGVLLKPVVVPGANIVIASNPLLAHIVAAAMVEAGFEMRGYVARLTMTMRGGDRPKNAHEEFSAVSVMPRSMWEPWVLLRRPLEGRVQDNLRKWGTGGLRRPNKAQPFGDVIKSSPTSKRERTIAPHPSLKPQAFLRQIVRGSLPLGKGTVLDPFAGSGSTLAAANAVGYASIGVEMDPKFVGIARTAIGRLESL